MDSYINFIVPIMGWAIAIGVLVHLVLKYYFPTNRDTVQSDSERIDKLRKDIKEMSENVQRMDDIMNKKDK